MRIVGTSAGCPNYEYDRSRGAETNSCVSCTHGTPMAPIDGSIDIGCALDNPTEKGGGHE